MDPRVKHLVTFACGFSLACLLRCETFMTAPGETPMPLQAEVVTLPDSQTVSELSPSTESKGSLVPSTSGLARVTADLSESGWSRQEISLAIAAKLECELLPRSNDFWRTEDLLSQTLAAERKRTVQAKIDLQLAALGLETRSEQVAGFLPDPSQRAVAAELIRLAAEAQGTMLGDSLSTAQLLQWAEQQHLNLFSQLSTASRQQIEHQFSAEAIRLRAMPDMNWTPETFTRALEVERRYAGQGDQAVGPRADQLEQARMQELGQVLGSDGLTQFLRAQDPVYESVALWSSQHGLTADTTAWLYDQSVAASQGLAISGEEMPAPIPSDRSTQPNLAILDVIRAQLGASLADDFANGPGSWLLTTP